MLLVRDMEPGGYRRAAINSAAIKMMCRIHEYVIGV